MKRFLILRFTPGNTKTVFEMVNRFLNIYSDFIGGIPFICTADCTRIGTKILFRINVNHSSTGRSGTWMITVAYAFRFLCGASHFHFILGHTNYMVGRPQRKWDLLPSRFMGREASWGQQGTPCRICRFLVCFSEEYMLFQRKLPEADIYRFQWSQKAASPRNVLGLISGCFLKKSFSTGMRASESARLLSSSGESDFFPTTISGWAFRIKADIPDNAKPVWMPNLKA